MDFKYLIGLGNPNPAAISPSNIPSRLPITNVELNKETNKMELIAPKSDYSEAQPSLINAKAHITSANTLAQLSKPASNSDQPASSSDQPDSNSDHPS